MEIKEIQNLIRFVSKSNVAEVNLKLKDFEIKIVNNKEQSSVYIPTAMAPQQPVAAAPAPQAPAPAPAAAPPAKEATEEESKYLTVKAPMIGTFYRSSAPDKDPFVKVGDKVGEGSVLCIIEAMKLFNEIESDVSGTIVKILVNDGDPIEYDQPLFLIDPS